MNTKRTLRAWIPLLLAGGLFLVGCNEAPMPPSDIEILHFTQHASAFEDIRVIIDHCPYGRYYPPYDEQDTACLQGVSVEDRRRLDSLLAEIGSERIFYVGREWRGEMSRASG